jgi:hypothetical protein
VARLYHLFPSYLQISELNRPDGWLPLHCPVSTAYSRQPSDRSGRWSFTTILLLDCLLVFRYDARLTFTCSICIPNRAQCETIHPRDYEALSYRMSVEFREWRVVAIIFGFVFGHDSKSDFFNLFCLVLFFTFIVLLDVSFTGRICYLSARVLQRHLERCYSHWLIMSPWFRLHHLLWHPARKFLASKIDTASPTWPRTLSGARCSILKCFQF